MDIALGSVFSSYASFEEALAKLQQEQSQVYVISSSKRLKHHPMSETVKYDFISFDCKYGGRMRKSSSTGQRPNQSTWKVGCDAKIRLVATSKDGAYHLRISICDLQHSNHPTGGQKPYVDKRKSKRKSKESDVLTPHKLSRSSIASGSNEIHTFAEADVHPCPEAAAQPRPNIAPRTVRVECRPTTLNTDGVFISAKCLRTPVLRYAACRDLTERIDGFLPRLRETDFIEKFGQFRHLYELMKAGKKAVVVELSEANQEESIEQEQYIPQASDCVDVKEELCDSSWMIS